jgi:hypothetical protein
MRLAILENGHTSIQKLYLRLIKFSMGHIPGPISILTYHKRWFGNHYARCIQKGMRKSKVWSKGELELFAAFVSKLNECVY